MLSVLRNIRKAKWYRNDNVPWLADGDLQADALNDLATESNGMSVWIIEDDKSNLSRIVAALAVHKGNLAAFDYAIMNYDLLLAEGFVFQNALGKTHDEEANTWHRDLIQLTTKRLFRLVEIIRPPSISIQRIPEKQVAKYIAESLTNHYLDRSDISPSILAKVNNL